MKDKLKILVFGFSASTEWQDELLKIPNVEVVIEQDVYLSHEAMLSKKEYFDTADMFIMKATSEVIAIVSEVSAILSIAGRYKNKVVIYNITSDPSVAEKQLGWAIDIAKDCGAITINDVDALVSYIKDKEV